MPLHTTDPISPSGLRARAVSKLADPAALGPSEAPPVNDRALAALGVLHELASSPDTAAHALALLHELQVYQVELELQSQELRAINANQEAALARQLQLYDSVPVSLFTVDMQAKVLDANLTGAGQLGLSREALLGQALGVFLTPTSSDSLLACLASMANGMADGVPTCELSLHSEGGDGRTLYASVKADPIGHGFLLAIMGANPRLKT
jgi:PAS domain-containing protein